MLAADYSYFILLMDQLRRSELEFDNLEAILKNPRDALGSFFEERQVKLRSFLQKLKELGQKRTEETDFPAISEKTFNAVVNFYESTSARDFAKCFSSRATDENKDEDQMRQRFLECLMLCLCNFEQRMWDSQVVPLIARKEATKYFSKIVGGKKANIKKKIQDGKTALLESNETFQIVNDVMLNPDSECLDGRMKIVRASKEVNANVLYTTLVLARHVACKRKERETESYTFEVIRDFGNFKLENFQEKYDAEIVKPDMISRVRQVLQQEKCQHRNRLTHEPCPCTKYGRPSLPSLDCINCSHEHTVIKTYKHLNKLPCILIVIYRGRVGDTFPPSFNCMDLRVMDQERKAQQDSKSVSFRNGKRRTCR